MDPWTLASAGVKIGGGFLASKAAQRAQNKQNAHNENVRRQSREDNWNDYLVMRQHQHDDYDIQRRNMLADYDRQRGDARADYEQQRRDAEVDFVKSREAALNDQKFQYKRLREAAELAGFNPLTVLKMAGAANGGPNLSLNSPSMTSVGMGGVGMGSAGLATGGYIDSAPALSSAEWIRDSFDLVGDMIAPKDPMEAERQKLEMDLLRAQIKRTDSPFGPTTNTVVGSAASNAPREDYRLPSITFGGNAWKTDPGTSDAEATESRYGDIIQEVYGFGVLASDLWHNANDTVRNILTGGRTNRPEIGPLMAPKKRREGPAYPLPDWVAP